jgi:outer membrane protein OmpA-like peptidoglycan-associated protein
MSDAKERTLVRENYLKKKLGLTHSDADLDEAVVAVGQRMKADRTKNRVTVYYLLAEHFGSLGIFGGASGASSVAPLAAAGLAGAGLAPAAAAATPAREAQAAAPSDGGGGLRPDDGIFGWGCGIAALVLGAIILAALLAWAMSRPDAAAPVAPAPAPATEVAAPAPVVAAPPAVPEGAGVIASDVSGRPKLTVYFDVGKSAVTNDLEAAASALKDYMAKNPDAKIAVSGYNDPTGNAAMNAELSKNRAQAVAKALEGIGIPAAAINLEKPAATTDAAVTAAEARRVEVVVKP